MPHDAPPPAGEVVDDELAGKVEEKLVADHAGF